MVAKGTYSGLMLMTGRNDGPLDILSTFLNVTQLFSLILCKFKGTVLKMWNLLTDKKECLKEAAGYPFDVTWDSDEV